MRRVSRFIACLLLVASVAAAQANKPSLVVVISIDQFRYDYLERFAPWFTDGGFNRFLKSGATFTDAHYLHAVTFTGPGHATIGSGKSPSQHGIVGNTWFVRGPVDAKRWAWYFDDSGGYAPPVKSTPDPAQPYWFEQTSEGSPQYCVYDDTVNVTAGKTTGMSPRQLIGEGLGDRMKSKYAATRVVSVSLKDRAAILMAGRNADAAYWFDYRLPGFVSSSYYHFDPKLFAFNATVTGYIPGSQAWNLAPYIPPADLQRVTFDPPAAWPLKNDRYGGTFPHPVKDVRAITYSPYGSDMLGDFALWTIDNEALGSKTATPDVLFVSFSSTDYFGHYYGPDSMEAADGVVRIDRTLERFLSALDRRFGDRVVVALTADHGVQSTPEILKLKEPNADAARIDLRNPFEKGQRISDLPPLRIEIERQLAARLNTPFSADAPYSHALVYFFEEPAIYLNQARLRELKLEPERVKRTLRDVVLKIDGVASAYTDTEIRAGRAPKSVRVSYLQGRSGDVFMVLRPNWIWSWGSNSTTHGQPVENDTHVPLLFWGAGVKPGRYDTAVSTEDLAKTLGAMFGVDAGGADAHVLPVVRPSAPISAADEEWLIKRSLLSLDPSGKTTRDDVRIGPLEMDEGYVTVRIFTGRPPAAAPPGTLSM
ncbi:MAG TPA: alkaline phosphatase family protein, partial [Thermoanaerobaculia bacterium]|nr:alkaline phosphatase family protein [Thermoanaerobaculia bacterium]